MRQILFRAKPNKAYFFESDNVATTDGFVFGTPDTRMLNVPGAEKWRKEHEMVDQPSIVAMTRDGWPYSVAVLEETIGQFTICGSTPSARPRNLQARDRRATGKDLSYPAKRDCGVSQRAD